MEMTERVLRMVLLALLVAALGLLLANVGAALVGDRDPERAEYVPRERMMPLHVQVAYGEQEIFFRFRWPEPNPSWYHDYLVYRGGEWVPTEPPLGGPDPQGLREDRVNVMIDDGSVEGFANFGAHMLVHEGIRTIRGEVPEEQVRAHPYFGEELGESDIRKYLPQSRVGTEWWEAPWDRVQPPEVLEELLDEGVFIDLWQWRAHRSNPLGYGDDQYVLDYRHSDPGTGPYFTNWDDEAGQPELMFDPARTGFPALRIEELERRGYSQADAYFLAEELAVPYDPNHAWREGDALPRRVLRPPEGSRGTLRASGVWAAGEWVVELTRARDTGFREDKPFVEGRSYTLAFSVHRAATARWHYVSLPYQMRLGEPTGIEAVRVEGSPDWARVPSREIPLFFPGQITWSWLTSPRHPGHERVRTNAISIWDVHDPRWEARQSALRERRPPVGYRAQVALFALVLVLGATYLAVRERVGG